MLVQFAVENYLSFKNEAVLNMTATTDSQHKNHVIQDEKGKKIEVLRSAALYGANASGKSNLVKAMEFARNLIINGTRPDAPIPVVPFKLDPEFAIKPSKFEFIIKHEGVMYSYGFVVDKKQIVEEWLYGNSNRRSTTFFERTTDEKLLTKIEFGTQLAPKNSEQADILEYIAKGTRYNQLFLTESHERNVEKVKPLMYWFQNILTILRQDQFEKNNHSPYLAHLSQNQYSIGTIISRLEEEPRLEKYLENVLKEIMSEIKYLYIGKYFQEKSKPSKVYKGLTENNKPINIREHMINDKNIESYSILYTLHNDKTPQEKPVPFMIDEESDGTQRLIQLFPLIYDAIKQGKVFIIDELERSLHPHLSRFFIETFFNTKPFNGQIIFATHETTLMDLDIFRRDEIWFAEKDEEESSRIYSLAEFRVRNDLRVDKGYLLGRFGAIPFFGDAGKLGIEIKT